MGGTSRCSLLCLRVLICFGSEIMLCASCSASFLFFQKAFFCFSSVVPKFSTWMSSLSQELPATNQTSCIFFLQWIAEI